MTLHRPQSTLQKIAYMIKQGCFVCMATYFDPELLPGSTVMFDFEVKTSCERIQQRLCALFHGRACNDICLGNDVLV